MKIVVDIMRIWKEKIQFKRSCKRKHMEDVGKYIKGKKDWVSGITICFPTSTGFFSPRYDKPPIEANKVIVTNIERVGLVKRRVSIDVVGKDEEGRIE